MTNDAPGSLADLIGGVSLRQLLYLRTAAQQPSFTAAAAALGITQPALSQALLEVERRVGAPLFEAAGRHRRLTGDGREVLAFAEQVLAEAAALRDRLDARGRGEAGTLRVGMIDAASLYVLPDIIREYREQHPAVDLQLHVDATAALLTQLRTFELDLVFAIGPPEDGFEGVEVLREPLHVYAPPGRDNPHAPPLDAEWALYESGSHTRAIIDVGLGRLGIAPRVTLQSGNPEVLRQMVALGLGWSVLPPAVAEGASVLASRRGALVAQRSLFAMRRAGAAPHPRADEFLRLALAAA